MCLDKYYKFKNYFIRKLINFSFNNNRFSFHLFCDPLRQGQHIFHLCEMKAGSSLKK